VAGQVTDDTQLPSASRARSPSATSSTSPTSARRYIAWREHAFDIGNQTAPAISHSIGRPPELAGLAVWRDSTATPPATAA